MAIASNNLITYAEVKARVLQYIKSNCSNIDRFPDLGNGYVNGDVITLMNYPNNCIIKAKTNDPWLKSVSSATVNSQLDYFLTSRNLNSLANTTISHKALVNLCNNISAFICEKLVIMTNPHTSGKFILYVAEQNNPGSVTALTDETISYNALLNSTKQLTDINAIVRNVHLVNCDISYTCSSSSSSCSSSSCSSSSSCFIAYMKI